MIDPQEGPWDTPGQAGPAQRPVTGREARAVSHRASSAIPRAASAVLVAVVLAFASLILVPSAGADPGMGTVVVEVGDPTGSFTAGFCADSGVPVSGSPVCSDGRGATLRSVSGGATTALSLPTGGYTAALASSGPSALGLAGPVVVLEEQTIVCVFTMAAAPACSLAPGSGPGTVVVQVGEATGSYLSGFCAVPGVPQLGTPVCSDGRAAILQSVSGGGSISVTLPAGRFTAALAAVGSTTLGPVGPIRVLGGQTIVCTFTMALAPACVPAPGSGPGTVLMRVDELPGGDFAAGFCAVPGVPVAGTLVCSDGHTADVALSLVGGGSRAVSLPAGYYMAGLALATPAGLSPPGPGVVRSGQTLACSFTMAAAPVCAPDDGDGLVEPPAGFPASYDGNGDGVRDVDQANVASLLPAVGSGPVTIASPAGTTVTGVTAASVPGSPTPPAGATFPVGVLGFTVQLAPGQTGADVEVILPTGSGPTNYYKLHSGAWLDFTSHASIVGDRVTLHLVDNAAFDTNGALGVIGDPGAPTIADRTPPVVTCPSPPNLLVNQGGASLTAAVTDTGSGVASPSVTVAVATGTVGAQSVAVSASDLAGNSTTVSCGYAVQYDFRGFKFPVNGLEVNKAKAGRIIPIIWRIVDANGNGVTSVASFTSLTSVTIACPGEPADTIELYLPFATGLVNLGGGFWTTSWKTPASYAGTCRRMQLNLADGTTRTAPFQFK